MTYDALIIGSGIGGLACAALLAKNGKRVLVLEKHTVAGGFTHTFSRQGYEWDVGVHYIGEVHRERALVRRLLDYVTDGELRWATIADPYDTAVFPDRAYAFRAGHTAFLEMLTEAFPGEEKALHGYLNALAAVTKAARSYYMHKALPPLAAGLARIPLTRAFRAFSDRTTSQVLQTLTPNKKLQSVLAMQWGDYGLPPSRSSFAIHALVAKHYLNGAAYPVGGSARFAETILPIIDKAGGAVRVKAGVEKILTQGNRAVGVKLESGEEITAPLVISDAGVFNTIAKLLPIETAAKSGLQQKLKNVERSLSHICLYAGIKASAAELNLPQGNLWIYPDYDYDRAIDAYLKDPKSTLPLAYISFPSAKDPDWDRRHPGRATIEVISFAPYEWFRQWEGTPWRKRGADYEDCKAAFSERLLDILYQHVPQVRGRVDYHELSTPLSTQHFSNNDRGEIYGLDHTPARFRQGWLKPRTPVKGLYLTGQDIVSDGIAGALMAGVLTASAVLGMKALKKVLSA